MKRFAPVTLLVLQLLFVAPASSTISFVDSPLYEVDTAQVTFYWDPPSSGPTPSGYEVKLNSIDTGQNFIYTTPSPSVTISRPRTGHFIVLVRSYILVDGQKNYSTAWIASTSNTDAQIWVNGVFVRQGGWILFWKMPAPGGGGIE